MAFVIYVAMLVSYLMRCTYEKIWCLTNTNAIWWVLWMCLSLEVKCSTWSKRGHIWWVILERNKFVCTLYLFPFASLEQALVANRVLVFMVIGIFYTLNFLLAHSPTKGAKAIDLFDLLWQGVEFLKMNDWQVSVQPFLMHTVNHCWIWIHNWFTTCRWWCRA